MSYVLSAGAVAYRLYFCGPGWNRTSGVYLSGAAFTARCLRLLGSPTLDLPGSRLHGSTRKYPGEELFADHALPIPDSLGTRSVRTNRAKALSVGIRQAVKCGGENTYYSQVRAQFSFYFLHRLEPLSEQMELAREHALLCSMRRRGSCRQGPSPLLYVSANRRRQIQFICCRFFPLSNVEYPYRTTIRPFRLSPPPFPQGRGCSVTPQLTAKRIFNDLRPALLLHVLAVEDNDMLSHGPASLSRLNLDLRVALRLHLDELVGFRRRLALLLMCCSHMEHSITSMWSPFVDNHYRNW